MKIQKTIIYIISFIATISFIVYIETSLIGNISHGNNISAWNTCVSNIAVGIFGSSIVSVIIAVITYFQEKGQLLDSFLYAYKKLLKHCSEFPKGNAYLEKIKWFQVYNDLCIELDCMADKMSFLLDFRKNAKFFKNVSEYYVDFSLLTQSAFFFLEEKQEKTEDEKKRLCQYIDSVVVEIETIKRGIMTVNTEYNRLTHNKELVLKGIGELNDKHFMYMFKKMMFNQTLVTPAVFIVLDENTEKYVQKIIKEMRRTNSGNIEIELPDEICETLLKKGYLFRYSSGKDNMKKLDCQFILNHYFRLKQKNKTKMEKNEEAMNIYSNLYSSVCFMISLLLFYVQTTFITHKTIVNLTIVAIILLTVLLQKKIKGFLEANGTLTKIINKIVISFSHIGLLACLIIALFELGGLTDYIQYIQITILIMSLWAAITAIFAVKKDS